MTSKTQLIASAFKKAGAFIYPKVCLHCNDVGYNGMDLCERCYQGLSWVQYACARCALPLPTGNAPVCGACSNRELHFDYAQTPFRFEGFIRDAVSQFKFNYKLNLGKLLAQLLTEHIENKCVDIPKIIVPVPLHKKRLRQRGYNQALEIARIVSKEISSGLVYDEIYRNRDTSVQMELPAKQRHKNVKDAFSVKDDSTILKNKHVCIVDDVMTTGNTVNEVAKCLKKVGAEEIGVWCIARVSTGKDE
ncbi:MAG: ComF family protein [Gammaproteobacteria bacterium]|nr:ComF family protein [Gammaproteobacteria bacterium]